jgi:formylmethanofuran dehydrogenase subunit D
MTAATNTKAISPVTFVAGAAVTANKLVKLSAENTVIHTTAITDTPIGFALNTAASGDSVVVETASGAVVKAIAGGTITVGMALMPKASGDGTLLEGAGSTAVSCAIALTGGASGETIQVLTRHSLKTPANS